MEGKFRTWKWKYDWSKVSLLPPLHIWDWKSFKYLCSSKFPKKSERWCFRGSRYSKTFFRRSIWNKIGNYSKRILEDFQSSCTEISWALQGPKFKTFGRKHVNEIQRFGLFNELAFSFGRKMLVMFEIKHVRLCINQLKYFKQF